MILESIDQ
jgi:superfamily II DNA helicase RecQ